MKARTASVVHATQPCSSGRSGVSISVDEVSAVTGEGGDDKRSSMGISLMPTENNVRRRVGSFTNRSDTLGGMVASTLVLYTRLVLA